MPLRLSAAILAQATAGVAALSLLSFWPPRRGPMLLVPVGGTLAETVNAALAGRAALLGPGPLPASIMVFGDRARITAAIGSRAIMVMAAPPAAGCGDFADRAADQVAS